MHVATLPIVILAALAGGCSESPATNPAVAGIPQPLVADIVTSYQSYRKMTDQPVLVNPEIAMLCRGLARENSIEIARSTKGPHANTAVLIYMNESAAQTFVSGGGSYSPGAVIVKQKSDQGYYDAESGKSVRSEDTGVGGMVKREPGFDPDHEDWEYFYSEAGSRIETGRIASCIQCHDAAKGADYVFGTWASR